MDRLRSKRYLKFKSFKGFSLIEMVLTIVMVGTALPGLIGMFATISNKSHQGELLTIANLLAIEQIEIILADKAGSGSGFGYSNINSAKYANVQPAAPFDSFNRTVTVQTVSSGQFYEHKVITVTVTHSSMPNVVLKTAIFNHSSI